MTADAPNVPADQGAREARYVEAIHHATEQATLGWPQESRRLFVEPILREVLGLADAEVAASVSEAQAEVERTAALIESWREHPALHLDDDGSVRINLHEVEGYERERVAQYRARTHAAEAEVERLREAARIGVELDNHHNAAVCPYCTPSRSGQPVSPPPNAPVSSGEAAPLEGQGYDLAPHVRADEADANAEDADPYPCDGCGTPEADCPGVEVTCCRRCAHSPAPVVTPQRRGERVMADIRPGACGEPGPYEAHCTEDRNHRYSCYDAGKDESWNTGWEWTHKHPGCPDDGLVCEGR